MKTRWYRDKNGALEVVRIAAYCPKRLSKKLVNHTNISASVGRSLTKPSRMYCCTFELHLDLHNLEFLHKAAICSEACKWLDAILQEQVAIVTCRVLGYLLLGVVRIYSKKVHYVCDNCEYLRVELNDLVSTKKTNTRGEARPAPYLSITLPPSFQLDVFDLQISEERTSKHVKRSEDLELKDMQKQTLCGYHFLDKNSSLENGSNFQSSSAVLSPTQEKNERVTSIEKLRENNSFFLDEFLNSVIPGLVEEPQLNDGEEMRVPNDETSVEVEGLTTVAALDEDDIVTFEHIKLPEIVLPHRMGNNQISFSTDGTPEPKGLNASSLVETSTADDVASVEVGEGILAPVSHDQDPDIDPVEPTMLHERLSPQSNQATVNTDLTPISRGPNSSGIATSAFPSAATTCDQNREIDTVEQIKLPEMVSPQRTQNNQASAMVDVTPVSKGPNVSGTAALAFIPVQTPASKEGSRVCRKRKRNLVDDTVVLPNRVLKESIADPSDLIRQRTEVPHNRFHVWKIQKLSNLPHNLFEPLIPYSPDIASPIFIEKNKKIQEVEAIPNPEKTNVIENPVVHLSSDQRLNIPESPIIDFPPDQADIAPSTPVPSTSSKLYDGTRLNTFSDVEEEQDNWTETNTRLTNEDIDSSAADGWEMDKWSVLTRAAASCLCKNFSSQRKQKERQVTNLFHILEGKNKSDSARMFYEILVLKSGGYVDVNQLAAYGDIVILKTSKLKI